MKTKNLCSKKQAIHCSHTCSTGIHHPCFWQFVLEFKNCQSSLSWFWRPNRTNIFCLVTLIKDYLIGLVKGNKLGTAYETTSACFLLLRVLWTNQCLNNGKPSNRKDTTPSKSSPHQWSSCLNLVLYFPPDWLSPIREEYVAKITPFFTLPLCLDEIFPYLN